MTRTHLTSSPALLVTVLAALAIVVMLGMAVLAYEVPSLRGDTLRSPQGTAKDTSWTVMD